MQLHKHHWVKVRKLDRPTGKGMEYASPWLVKCSICGKEVERWYDD